MIDILLMIATLSIVILLSIIVVMDKKYKESTMQQIKKAKKDMIDLETITRNLEDYHPVNIELTSYEKEQENNAIISYDELVSSKDKAINYEEEYGGDMDIQIKKVDLKETTEMIDTPKTKIEVTLMSYEKEEAFLKALKQLQRDLAS